MRFSLLSLPTIALLAVALPAASSAASVAFYTSESSFDAALASLNTVDFEGIVADSSSQFYGAAASIGGINFTGSSNGLTTVGKSAAYAGSNFYSAFLGEGNGGNVLATVGPNIIAIGANVGDVYQFYSTTLTNDLTLTLTGGSGVLDTRTIGLSGFVGTTPPPQFVGFIVSGDTIQSLRFATGPGSFIGIDNIQTATTASGVPEPGSFALISIGLVAGFLVRRGKKPDTAQ
jgi:PEP-CTERM motif